MRTMMVLPVPLGQILFARTVASIVLAVGSAAVTSAALSYVYGITLNYALFLLLVVILAFGSYLLAAMATFLLLEQKDEHTLNTIAVTPIGACGYLKFKMVYIYLMSAIGNIVILLGTKLIAGDRCTVLGMSLFDSINLSHIISSSVVNALLTRHLACCRAPLPRTRWRASPS